MSHSVTPIRPRDYLSTPWMVQLIPGVDIYGVSMQSGPYGKI